MSFMDSPLDKTVDVLEAITRSVKAYTFSVAAIGGNIFLLCMFCTGWLVNIVHIYLSKIIGTRTKHCHCTSEEEIKFGTVASFTVTAVRMASKVRFAAMLGVH